MRTLAYASTMRANHLWSAAQFNSADPKNRTECDTPLVSRADAEAAIAAKDAEIAKLREALEPFAKAFQRRRDEYSKRYRDSDLGYANFDKMPDDWAMEKVAFNMGAYRRACAALAGGSDATL